MTSPLKFELTPGQEEAIQIYHEYFVLNWEWLDICRKHNCSKSKVSKSIRWVIKNKLSIPSKHLLKGAIDAVSSRLRQNKELLAEEMNRKKRKDKNFIISLNREIRDDEKMLYNLQEVYAEKVEVKASVSAADVLKLINEEAEK